MSRTITTFEAFDMEIWGLRTAHDRHRTVPILLDFAVRQREHSLADAIEATLQIYRRFRTRYRRDAATTSKTSLLVPEIEAYSNGLEIDKHAARVILPNQDGGKDTFVLDSDLHRIGENGVVQFPWRNSSGHTTDLTTGFAGDAASAWELAVERVATIGISVGFFGAGIIADRYGAFTCEIRGGAPGLPPMTPVTSDNAWYLVNLHHGLTQRERLAVLAEVLGTIFLGYTPRVWLGDGAWSSRESLHQNAPATAHWWVAPESRTPEALSEKPLEGGKPLLTVSSRSFTDLEARQAMMAGMIGAARAGLVPHLPSGRELGSPGQVVKNMRWVPVLEAAVQIEELLGGTMHPPPATHPTGRHSGGLDEA